MRFDQEATLNFLMPERGTAILVGMLCWMAVGSIVPKASSTGLSERQKVMQAMEDRPRDPWPRGEGHVVLAFPGSREADKFYLEPGGSFSPAVGSFGISFWIMR